MVNEATQYLKEVGDIFTLTANLFFFTGNSSKNWREKKMLLENKTHFPEQSIISITIFERKGQTAAITAVGFKTTSTFFNGKESENRKRDLPKTLVS